MLAIRDARESDLPALIALDAVARRDATRVATLRSAIVEGECFVAAKAGRVVGYAVLEHSFFGNGFLALVVVNDDARRSGVGSALTREAAARCRSAKLFTSTNASNEPMRRLLAKRGFLRSGVIENLDAGDPELVYARFLGSRDASVATSTPSGAKP